MASSELAAPLSASIGQEVASLAGELGEIDLLIAQARAEAERHEAKRAAAAERLASLSANESTPPRDLVDLSSSLATLTRRAAVMQAQVEVLEGKRKTLARFHESLGRVRDALDGVPVAAPEAAAESGAAGSGPGPGPAETSLPPAVSRLVLSAQEDLRREIARAMHDGPAQSLTNIVLQAQIVERLLARNPELAAGEVRQLVAMVQQTLDATKSFIFDVRPMVLDDLGLVPTLRRAARDRGRRAAVPVAFDSLGTDRRLPMELESGLFRILDEALAGFLSAGPDRVSLQLDWGEQLEARVAASRGSREETEALAASIEAEPERAAEPEGRGRRKDKDGNGRDSKDAKELPPALAAMMEDRRADRRAAAEAVRTAAVVTLPETAWREIQQRAATLGILAEQLESGGELRLVADLPG